MEPIQDSYLKGRSQLRLSFLLVGSLSPISSAAGSHFL